MLYFRMILTMLVSLYTSRVVLNVLGVEDFGINNIVGGVVTTFGFLNGAMSSATQRFLSFELGKNDLIQLRKVFNATQIIHLGIALLIFVLAETFGLWFLNTYLNLPENRMEAARWVYHFSVLSFMITIVQVPYNAVIIARERMNVYAYVSILEVFLKLLIVFALSWITYDSLKLYGFLLFGVALIIAAIYRVYTLRSFEETRFEFVKDGVLYKTLINYSGWNLFGGVAAISKIQGVGIILNIFFGTVVNAAQGVANQVSGAINMLVYNFQVASNPQIIKSYAAQDKQYFNQLVIRTAKYSFYLLFVLTLPIMLELEYILNLWLRIVPEYTVIFTMLLLVNALIECISGPLMTSLQATGQIKLYQSVVGVLLILVLPISYFLFSLGFPPYFIFVVGLMISVVAFIFRLWLVKLKIPEFLVGDFLKEVVFQNSIIILFSLLIPVLILLNMSSGNVRLMMVALGSVVSSALFIFLLGLKSQERIFIKNTITGFLKIKI